MQMGRPIRYTPGELKGFAQRGRAMIALAPEALSDIVPPAQQGFRRYIRREPLGVVLVLAPWNTLAHRRQQHRPCPPGRQHRGAEALRPDTAGRRAAAGAARDAGIPAGVFQHIHGHELTAKAVADPRVAYVAFTGSVGGGRAVHQAMGGTFKAVGLELGGKDPAYVRPDVDLAHAIENLVDGAFFNGGELRHRAHLRPRQHYEAFVDGFVSLVEDYKLGDPTDPATTSVRWSVPQRFRDQAQIDAAVAAPVP